MRKITIKIIAQDRNNVRLGAEGSMMVSDKEYDDFLDDGHDDDFLDDGHEMLYHCDQTDDAVDRICRDTFAKVGITINKADDLKRRVERFYSEDGKLRSFSATEFLRGNECQFDNSNPRQVQDGLHNFLEIAQEKFAQESMQNK